MVGYCKKSEGLKSNYCCYNTEIIKQHSLTCLREDSTVNPENIVEMSIACQALKEIIRRQIKLSEQQMV